MDQVWFWRRWKHIAGMSSRPFFGTFTRQSRRLQTTFVRSLKKSRAQLTWNWTPWQGFYQSPPGVRRAAIRPKMELPATALAITSPNLP